jgi:methylated-DNA-protein-cysteine methyltransferase related protein
MEKTVRNRIYNFVSKIPKGYVATYGQVAKKCGLKSARTVGFWLHRNSDPEKIPCHRVVFSDGSLSKNYVFGGEKEQRVKLKSEGVEFVGEKVSLAPPRGWSEAEKCKNKK